MSAGSQHTNSVYPIFVAGLPSKINYEQLLGYFSQFGQIGLMEDQSKTGRRPKGFQVIFTNELSTYHRILQTEHVVAGRRVFCKPFLQGTQLDMYNSLANKRRVIIRQVNSLVTEQSFKLLLESLFGKVEHLYAFKGNKISLSSSNRDFLTYSVMFADENSAEYAVSKSPFSVFGTTFAIAESFNFLRKRMRIRNSSSTNLYANTTTNVNNLYSTQRSYNTVRALSAPLHIYSRDGIKLVSESNSMEGVSAPSRSLSLTESNRSRLRVAVNQTVHSILLHSNHHCKPGTRIYFCFRQDLSSAQKSKVRRWQIGEPNYRLNVTRRSCTGQQ